MEPSSKLHLHAYSPSKIAVKYEALLVGLMLAQDLHVQGLLVRGDSLLIIQQVLGEYNFNEVHCKQE